MPSLPSLPRRLLSGARRRRRYTVIKTWYQDDFGLYGRFDERLTVALARHPAVADVIHVSPPLPPADLRARSFWAHNSQRLLARATGEGARLDGVWQFTPVGPPDRTAAAVEQARLVIERRLVPGTRAVLITTPPLPFVVELTDRLGPHLLRVTQIEDDHRLVWPDRAEAVDATYRRLLAGSAFGLVSSRGLANDYANSGCPLMLTPRVTEPERFRHAAPAADLLDVPGPIVIYTGWLGARLDLELLRRVMTEVRATFVFAGAGGERFDEVFRDVQNWLAIGPRPYSHLPHLLATARAAIVPHEVSTMTEGMTPEKVVHYLAAGLPVVATPVAGVRDLPPSLVRIARDAGSFAAALREVLAADPPEAAAHRRRAVAPMDENAVADWFVQCLDSSVTGRPLPAPPAIICHDH